MMPVTIPNFIEAIPAAPDRPDADTVRLVNALGSTPLLLTGSDEGDDFDRESRGIISAGANRLLVWLCIIGGCATFWTMVGRWAVHAVAAIAGGRG